MKIDGATPGFDPENVTGAGGRAVAQEAQVAVINKQRDQQETVAALILEGLPRTDGQTGRRLNVTA